MQPMMAHDEDSISVKDIGEDEPQQTSSSLKKKWMASSVLLLVILVYLFAGALIFSALERPGAVQASDDFDAALLRLASENDCLDEEDVAELMYIVTKAIGEGAYASGHPYASLMTLETDNETAFVSMWSVQSNFVFVTSVVTTVGFGYTAPRTVVGQFVCVLYALIGIPFVGTTILNFGKILKALRQHKFTKKILKALRRPKFTKKLKVCVVLWKRFRMAGVLVLNILLLCLLVVPPSLMKFFTQHWSFIDSYYFSVVAMTTIGFGDIQLGHSGGNSPNSKRYLKAFIHFTYQIIGIGLLSTMFDTSTKAQQREARRLSTHLYKYKARYHQRRRSKKQEATKLSHDDGDNKQGDTGSLEAPHPKP